MAQSMHAQKKRTSPARVTGGAFFLFFAIATFGLAVLVYILYISKQNSLPWTLNAVLLFILGLVFLVIGIGFFTPASQSTRHSGMNHCPGCGYKLHQGPLMRARCPNPQCDKMLGPEDFNAHFCHSCGTNVLQTISQMTGQLPAIKKPDTA